jgi:ribosomal protein S18 acetylase RimI-like enzyme
MPAQLTTGCQAEAEAEAEPEGNRRCAVDWYDGPRGDLRALFELAEDSPRQLDDYIDRGRVLVARDGRGRIVGHLQLLETPQPGVAEIKSLAVDADVQRRGIGRGLVEHALGVCRSEGATAVTLITAVADVDNVHFYQRCGFRATAIERDAFTPATGYPPDLSVAGIPLRDAIRFTIEL